MISMDASIPKKICIIVICANCNIDIRIIGVNIITKRIHFLNVNILKRYSL